ncbi:hypothetical protein OHA21_10735 [Actinoplanes sp. NBC_00393]|uniref:hypothetical protein n=1 Tax=Actinoplanes sp. NBC_00393 TaxID=2975953 RepID=UPI002E1BDC1F
MLNDVVNADFTAAGTAEAVLSHADRFVNVRDVDGSYLLSFHGNGRQRALGQTRDIYLAADAACRWVAGSRPEAIATVHPFVEFGE